MKAMVTSKWLAVVVVWMVGLAVRAQDPACINTASGGPAVGCPEGCDSPPECRGANPVRVNTRNVHRAVTDLELLGGTGGHRLAWRRYGNSRYVGSREWFGNAHGGWRHSYQWELASVGSALDVYTPAGAAWRFTKIDATTWLSQSTAAMRMTQNGNQYVLQQETGWRYHFEKLGTGSGIYYQLQDFTDNEGNVYTLTYDTEKRLIRVTEPGGRYLAITYASLPVTRVATTILGAPGTVVQGQWNELAISITNRFQYVRYIAGSSCYAALGEMECYNASSNLVSGTAFGALPAATSNQTPDKVNDGNTATSYRYLYPSWGFVGVDFGAGNTERITKIRFFPAGSMAYAQFQGLNELPETISVIAAVQASDGRSVTYQYQQFDDPSLPLTYQLLTGVQYGDGTQASYSYAQTYAGTRPLLTAATDPRYHGAGNRMQYEYNLDTKVYGTVRSEKNPLTGTELMAVNVFYGTTTVDYPNGGRVTLQQYTTGPGKVRNVTDALGRRTDYTYTEGDQGFVKTKTDPLGRATTYDRDVYGNVLTNTGPDNAKQIWTRNSFGSVLSHTDEANRTTSYTRDASNRVTRVDHPDNTYETWTYTSFGQPLSHRQKNGGMEYWSYDPQGRQLTHTDALNNATAYNYVNAGVTNDLPIAVTDARNNTTFYEYNDRGQVTRTTFADGNSRVSVYDTFGNKIAETNELGFATTWAYDEFNRVTTNRNALGQATIYSYDLPGDCGCAHGENKPTKIILPSGKQITIAYDKEWQKVSETVGYGTAEAATTQWKYDAAGNVLTNINPLGKATIFAYDTDNRRIRATDPLGNVTQWGYDAVGNILAETRPDGGITTNAYDIADRLVWSRDPKMQVTQSAYDASGNVTLLTDARGNSYGFTYDLLSRKTSMIYPGTGSDHEDYSYDAVGNLQTFRNRAGSIRTYAYDNRNRETRSEWNDGLTPAIDRTYDAAGRLLTLVNSASSLTYTYDAGNRLLGETSLITADGPAKTVAYTYDADGNRLTLTYPDGTVVTNSYSARNELTAISTVVSYQYDLAGNRARKTLGNGTTTGYTYDNASRLLSIVHSNATSQIARFDYALNAVGNRTSKTQVGTAGPAVRSESYSYDAIDQVTGAAYALDAVTNRTVSYQYDAVGNRQQVTDNGTNTAYTANALNQYSAVGLEAPTYDANGNLTGQGGWSYTYDAQNRLISAVGGSPSVAASFSYDARNRCMKRVINGTTTYLTYDGWSLLEERDAGDTLIHKYIHGAVIDEIIVRYNGSPVWYHHDALGSTTHVTDNTGTVVESYTYDVYGAPSFFDSAGIQQPVSSVQNRFLFTGRERLAEAGLYDYRNRFYSYVLGRFLQTDPIRPQASDINAYSYVRNSPIAYADPLGTYITYGSGGSASFWNELSGAYRRMWSTKAGKKLLNWAHALTLEVRICAWDENRHRTLRRSDTLVEILVPVNGTSHGHLAHELWHVAQYELGEARKGLLPVVEATDNSDPPAEPAVEWEAIRVQNIVSREYLELAHGGRIQHTPILNYPGIPGELQKPYGKYFE